MEPFDIQIDISGNISTLLVFPDPYEPIYEVYEDKNRLGVVYKDTENNNCWCSDEPIPMEIINLIGKQIDAYEAPAEGV
ncbi:hypothetical protein [Pedobacter nutrimenti]|uniref:hypothetical protein n=1 Tax=Pedobacter nutrimenti TaxID=1241337 RepID=UPI00292D05D7|nr:hypothetical protein [Pedobacter nutrimenti]